MEKTIRFTVNGEPQTVVTDENRSLVEVLREELQMTGTKYGCGEGQCGACTVLLNGKRVSACLTTIAEVEGQSILTVEGLAKEGRLHRIQEAFLAENAFQCGFCTPGVILAVVGLLNEKPHPTDQEIRACLEDHICRCCAYPNILKAVKRAAA